MTKSDYIKILKLAQGTLKEYENWGEFEAAKPAAKLQATEPRAAKPRSASPRGIKTAEPSVEQQQVNETEVSALSKNVPPALSLDAFKKEINGCQKCPLGKSRLNVVFGEGSPMADLMFIGEGPGFQEDHEGRPFIGRAGQLLTKIIEAMGYKREDVFIANIVKCHPMKNPSNPELRGNDRPPSLEEMSACKPYLDKQIEIIRPKVLCTLGSSSTKALLETDTGISALRGNFGEYKGVKLMPTYHPAALLRNPNLKKFVWDDMKKILSFLKTGNI